MPAQSQQVPEKLSSILDSISNRTRLFALLALILEGLSAVALYSLPTEQRFSAFTISIAVLFSALLVVFVLELRSQRPIRISGTSDVVALLEDLVTKHKKEITPPTLAFLAIAERLTYPDSHGRDVAGMNPAWTRDASEWRKRAEMLEKLGLFVRSHNEFARSELGSLYAFVALRDPHYGEALSCLKAKGWHFGLFAA